MQHATKAKLLIEILVEEMSAKYLKSLNKIALEKFKEICQEYRLISNAKFYFTPRRLVIYDDSFPTVQISSTTTIFGPPLSIAYEDSAHTIPSRALASFLNKCNLTSTQSLQKVDKDGKEVLAYVENAQCQKANKLLALVVEKWLKELDFTKSMRWGSNDFTFIRPIRNVMIFLGDEFIKLENTAFSAEPHLVAHRDFTPTAIASASEYFSLLAERGVVLDPLSRREIILEGIKSLEKSQNIKVEIDFDLLDEIVAITEHPRAILGSFDAAFLSLPQEVIITSMKENQRYFAIYKDSKLYNGFVVVTNSTAKDCELIKIGNEKVLKARLNDAMFFYKNDLSNPLESYDLSSVNYLKGLGLMSDKVSREVKIGQYLAKKYNIDEVKIKRAINLAKKDLLSEMVGEFPELQGIMGGYYAGAQGEEEAIVEAIKTQYLPNSQTSAMPKDSFSAIVSLAYKIENILGLFSIGEVPTGSKDPYALRRSALGIARVVLEFQLDFDLLDDLGNLYHLAGFSGDMVGKAREFMLERVYYMLNASGINEKFSRAFTTSANAKRLDICTICKDSRALFEISKDGEFAKILPLFKRVANLSKNVKTSEIKPSLFNEFEVNLFDKFNEIRSHKSGELRSDLLALLGLVAPLNALFDNVLINDENKDLKQNRLSLLRAIYDEFNALANLDEIIS